MQRFQVGRCCCQTPPDGLVCALQLGDSTACARLPEDREHWCIHHAPCFVSASHLRHITPAPYAPLCLPQENLSERLRLLAELHWSLPHPPSRAEQLFAHEQLPAFEAAAAALQDDARALRARVSTLQRKLRSMGDVAAGAAAVAAGSAAVPPHQLRRVREALAEQEQQIGSNQQRLAVLEEAAAAAAAVRG